MVDLRIDVVRPAGQNDAVTVMLLQPGDGLLPFFLQIQAGAKKLLPGQMGGSPDFLSGDLEFLLKFRGKLFRQHFFIGKGHKRIEETNILFCQLFHIIFNILRIGGNHRTVVVVSSVRLFVPLIGNAGIENSLHALGNKPGDVSVDNLGRIAFRLAGNGFNSQLINLSGRLRR